MACLWTSDLIILFLIPLIEYADLSDTSAWIKQDTLPISYYSAPVGNNLRCGKLCERQMKCIGASFGVLNRICYLHEVDVTTTTTDCHGKYMFRKVDRESEKLDSPLKCGKTQIRVPSAGGEMCLDAQIPERCDEGSDYFANVTLGFSFRIIYCTREQDGIFESSVCNSDEQLVIVDTVDKQSFVETIMETHDVLYLQIGMFKDTASSEWKWVNGSHLDMTHWQQGQPSGNGNCGFVVKGYHYRWDDATCTKGWDIATHVGCEPLNKPAL